LRCDFFGAADDPWNPADPDRRCAPLAAPVFGRGADLPKLGIVLIASSLCGTRRQEKAKFMHYFVAACVFAV
jgi:hypothetical protein